MSVHKAESSTSKRVSVGLAIIGGATAVALGANEYIFTDNEIAAVQIMTDQTPDQSIFSEMPPSTTSTMTSKETSSTSAEHSTQSLVASIATSSSIEPSIPTTSETELSTPSIPAYEGFNGLEIVPPSDPLALTIFNKDQTPLLSVTLVPQALDENAELNPHVALSHGDNRGVWLTDAGRPNTRPGDSGDIDDYNGLFYSHTSTSDDPARALAFQYLGKAEVGGIVHVQTGEGLFVYEMTFNGTIPKHEMGASAAYTRNKGRIAIVSCVQNSNADNQVVIAELQSVVPN